MQIHGLTQGSNEWLQFRQEHFGASEAAAMLGLSKKVKRTELLHMKHTGNTKEFSDWVQTNILDYGHEVEALARPILEEELSEDLYPVTCSEGRLSASCDGLTMAGNIAFEHKQWNEELAASVSDGVLPEDHAPQVQQILMVTGAEVLIFVVSDGTAEKRVKMECAPDPEWFSRIAQGWTQFATDLAEYKPKEIPEKPLAGTIMQLPALAVQIKGEVVLSNLPQFKAAATTFIQNIKTELTTDEDFANAEATVKFCKKAEEELELTKTSAIGQTASIDELMKTIDFIRDELRTKRLTLEKLVASEKTAIKAKILADVRELYLTHIVNLEAEMRPLRLDSLARPDFIAAAKNKRTLASLHDAVDTELARAKIAADVVAKDYRAKLAWYKTNTDGFGFLFSDLTMLATKPMDDFQLVITTRIANHVRAEEAKEDAQREAIRKEEEAKALAKVEAERTVVELKLAKASPDGAELSPTAQAMYESEGAQRFISMHQSNKKREIAPLHGWPLSVGHKAVAPTDEQIIELVGEAFNLSSAQTIARLSAIDFTAARANLIAEAA